VIHEDGAGSGQDPRRVKKLIHTDKVFMIHGGNCSAAVVAAATNSSTASASW